ncbi:MAG: hypothetical protein HC933_09445 [Pleurocapsa sp. SU_196_0]|nr:hypothetical protein [Pleurocapsa sp. SU_196_0]
MSSPSQQVHFDTVILETHGGLRAWGENESGQLGNGSSDNSDVPVRVQTRATGVRAIAAGGFHSLAVQGDGTLLGWGANHDGQLATGDNESQFQPILTVIERGHRPDTLICHSVLELNPCHTIPSFHVTPALPSRRYGQPRGATVAPTRVFFWRNVCETIAVRWFTRCDPDGLPTTHRTQFRVESGSGQPQPRAGRHRHGHGQSRQQAKPDRSHRVDAAGCPNWREFLLRPCQRHRNLERVEAQYRQRHAERLPFEGASLERRGHETGDSGVEGHTDFHAELRVALRPAQRNPRERRDGKSQDRRGTPGEFRG